jgi:hypothetical protein
MTVSSLRFPGVNFDLSYESFRDRWRNPATRASGFWTYIDARDAAMTCRLALEAKFTGHQVFIASAAKNCMIQPSRELQKISQKTRFKNFWHPLSCVSRKRRRIPAPRHLGKLFARERKRILNIARTRFAATSSPHFPAGVGLNFRLTDGGQFNCLPQLLVRLSKSTVRGPPR